MNREALKVLGTEVAPVLAKAEADGRGMKGITGVRCHICGRGNAQIRRSELKVARISKRAHVDCVGHSQYRSVTLGEIGAALAQEKQDQ